eukprot:3604726-Rhodomonas_salina.1
MLAARISSKCTRAEATVQFRLPAYACATRHPVLTSHLLLPAENERDRMQSIHVTDAEVKYKQGTLGVPPCLLSLPVFLALFPTLALCFPFQVVFSCFCVPAR